MDVNIPASKQANGIDCFDIRSTNKGILLSVEGAPICGGQKPLGDGCSRLSVGVVDAYQSRPVVIEVGILERGRTLGEAVRLGVTYSDGA